MVAGAFWATTTTPLTGAPTYYQELCNSNKKDPLSNYTILQRAEEGWNSEVGIYKRKQELDQESDQEKNKVFFLFSWSLSCFLDRFICGVLVFFFFLDRFNGRVLVFLLSCLLF